MTPTQLLDIKGEFEKRFEWVIYDGDGELSKYTRDKVWQWFESKLQAAKASIPVDILCEVEDKGIALIKVEDKIYTIIKGIYLDDKSNKLNIKELSDGYTVGIESGKEREVFVFPKTGECKTLTLKELNKGIRKIRKSGWSSE